MKRIEIIAGQIISGFIIIFIFNSCLVVKTPYLKTGYYQKTVSRLNSLKSDLNCVNDSLYAGFARISITPSLNNKVMNSEEGRFNKIPLAGYGERKGKPATGVHDSIFVKAVALKEGLQTLILVSADLLIMPPNIIDSVTKLLSKEGVQRNQLYFSATHSHSSIGGWAYGLVGKQFAGKENINLEMNR